MATYTTCEDCGRPTPLGPTTGTLRRHPKGAVTPCPGSGRTPDPESTPQHPVPHAGIYRSHEAMLDPALKPPHGYVTLSIVAHVPYDGTNGRTPEEEAALLFEDPGYLSTVLDAVPNDRIRLLLKVDQ